MESQETSEVDGRILNTAFKGTMFMSDFCYHWTSCLAQDWLKISSRWTYQIVVQRWRPRIIFCGLRCRCFWSLCRRMKTIQRVLLKLQCYLCLKMMPRSWLCEYNRHGSMNGRKWPKSKKLLLWRICRRQSTNIYRLIHLSIRFLRWKFMRFLFIVFADGSTRVSLWLNFLNSHQIRDYRRGLAE